MLVRWGIEAAVAHWTVVESAGHACAHVFVEQHVCSKLRPGQQS
jgi:hypothetical protein